MITWFKKHIKTCILSFYTLWKTNQINTCFAYLMFCNLQDTPFSYFSVYESWNIMRQCEVVYVWVRGLFLFLFGEHSLKNCISCYQSVFILPTENFPVASCNRQCNVRVLKQLFLRYNPVLINIITYNLWY